MEHNINEIVRLLATSEKFTADNIHYFREIDSTNDWLLRRARSNEVIDGGLCLAESQESGKGRRGKSWIATASGSVLMSIGWRLDSANPQGLSLISGVAVVQSLLEQGVNNVLLKWPNDILIGEKKLGGILVEISGLDCVIGVGINVNIPQSFDRKIGQPWTDLFSLGYQVDRDMLVAAIALNHERILGQYMLNGFAPFVETWNSLHAYQNHTVEISSKTGTWEGTAMGVNDDGALLVEQNGVVQSVFSGQVSIRSSGYQKGHESFN
jgi:BirA family biotin operon repressor/biotin-[acetyl-CoA-carboxylase] ligase